MKKDNRNMYRLDYAQSLLYSILQKLTKIQAIIQ